MGWKTNIALLIYAIAVFGLVLGQFYDSFPFKVPIMENPMVWILILGILLCGAFLAVAKLTKPLQSPQEAY